MLDKTPFYPESGGPVGDKGVLIKQGADSTLAQVLDTQKYFGLNLSRIHANKSIGVNDVVRAVVDNARLEIAKHHSATHLLHKALRDVLGSHIAQAGSLVESTRLRFDFSHPKAVSGEELAQIESLVNAAIARASKQECEYMGINEAKAKGAMALFGEKYGDVVRVVRFGDSIELCGGIHTGSTAEIGSFYIIKESGVSSGVRRIEAVCGAAAYSYGRAALDSLKIAKESLKAQDVMQGIEKLKGELAKLKEREKKAKSSVKSLDFEEINGATLIISQLDSIDSAQAKELVDKAKNENMHVAILLISQSEGKIAITAGVKGIDSLKAGAWVREVAQILGGNGGGRDDFATAGGKDMSKISQALNLARDIALKAV